MLRHAKVSPKDVQIYCLKIGPIVEYAAPVWHGGLMQEQSDSIEHMQERAMKIVYPQLTYEEALQSAGIRCLCDR